MACGQILPRQTAVYVIRKSGGEATFNIRRLSEPTQFGFLPREVYDARTS